MGKSKELVKQYDINWACECGAALKYSSLGYFKFERIANIELEHVINMHKQAGHEEVSCEDARKIRDVERRRVQRKALREAMRSEGETREASGFNR